MGKRVRILTVAGMALVAGAAIGASPAQATTSTGQAATKPAQVQVQSGGDRDWVAGYYRSYRACERAGWLGERFNRWDEYECDRVDWGFRRGWVALEVESNDWGWGGGNGHGHGHGNGNHNGHGNNNGHGNGPWNHRR